MTAREYLEQIAVLDELIKSKALRVGRLKDEAKRTSAKLDGERVQSSGSKQKMADTVVKYVYIEEVELKALYEQREEVISTIKQLPYREYDVLFKFYVLGYQLDEIAKRYHRSYSWAQKSHAKGLKLLQNILERIEE